MIRRLALPMLVALALAGCGGRVNLKPQEGKTLPVKPEGAAKQATPDELMTPGTQAAPKRSDEPLKRSEERRDDKFDLPPDS